MGHVARFENHDPDRVTYKVFRYKDLKYITDLQAQFGHQTHGRRLHVWRLEWDLFKFFGADWQELAKSEQAFNSRWEAWLDWRLSKKL